jgi:GNAT superfamily N-acetyltransferase
VHVAECRRQDLEALERAMPTRGSGAHAKNFALHEDGRWTMLVAWADPTVAGGVAVIRWEDDCPKLTNLQVAESWRGHGMGTALIEAAEAKVREQGRRELAIDVADDNLDAAKLYLRLGYRDTGRVIESRYEYPDESGRLIEAVEHNRRLLKELGP